MKNIGYIGLYILLRCCIANTMECTATEQSEAPALPPEIKVQIIMQLVDTDSFEKTIKNIARISVINRDFNQFITAYDTSFWLIRYLSHTFQKSCIDFDKIASRLSFSAEAKENYFKQVQNLKDAVVFQQKKKVKELFAAGADSNAITVPRNNPILLDALMCKYPNYAIVRLLLQYDANPNVSTNGITPLHYIACWSRRIDLVNLLIKHGACIEQADLDCAIMLGNNVIAKRLKGGIKKLH